MPIIPFKGAAKAAKRLAKNASPRTTKKHASKGRAAKYDTTDDALDNNRRYQEKHRGKKKKFVQIHDKESRKKLKNRPRQTRKANKYGRT
jgi:hypothetical protein